MIKGPKPLKLGSRKAPGLLVSNAVYTITYFIAQKLTSKTTVVAFYNILKLVDSWHSTLKHYILFSIYLSDFNPDNSFSFNIVMFLCDKRMIAHMFCFLVLHSHSGWKHAKERLWIDCTTTTRKAIIYITGESGGLL